MNVIEPTPFQLLLDDLDELQRTKYARQGAAPAPSRRDTVTRATAPRPMQKAAPPVDFDRLAREQEKLEKAMRTTQTLHTQNAVRERLADIGADYRAGRLTAHQAAMYDVLRNRAGAMGLRP